MQEAVEYWLDQRFNKELAMGTKNIKSAKGEQNDQ